MIGIEAYGAYIPRFRINRQTISQSINWLSQAKQTGEKAIGNHDEDSISMGVAAIRNCLVEIEKSTIDSLYFSTTTAPYNEKESSGIIATALDLRSNLRTTDLTDTLKAGTGAILAAYDSIKAGNAKTAMVCSADCRTGKPGSSQELLFGDGAAAVLLGDKNVIATIENSFSLSYDFPDYTRAENERYVRNAEDRFIREIGYSRFIPEAITGLLKKQGIEIKDIAKIAFPCTNTKIYAQVAKQMGFKPEQVQQPLLDVIGESGTASPVLLLIAMLEDANPGDNLIIASYGNGSDAVLFKVTEAIKNVKNRKQLKTYINSKKYVDTYDKYLVFRKILSVDTGFGPEIAPTQLPLTWRERSSILALIGTKCKTCGTPQYPPQRICVNPKCGAIDTMEPYSFADKKGKIFSYTLDNASYSPNPPLIFSMIDFDGGGRYIFEITDCEPETMRLDMPIEMSFRRKYIDESRGITGYFWKAMPAR